MSPRPLDLPGRLDPPEPQIPQTPGSSRILQTPGSPQIPLPKSRGSSDTAPRGPGYSRAVTRILPAALLLLENTRSRGAAPALGTPGSPRDPPGPPPGTLQGPPAMLENPGNSPGIPWGHSGTLRTHPRIPRGRSGTPGNAPDPKDLPRTTKDLPKGPPTLLAPPQKAGEPRETPRNPLGTLGDTQDPPGKPGTPGIPQGRPGTLENPRKILEIPWGHFNDPHVTRAPSCDIWGPSCACHVTHVSPSATFGDPPVP